MGRRPALPHDIKMSHEAIPNLENCFDYYVAKKEGQKWTF
jgi:hypothetical protein